MDRETKPLIITSGIAMLYYCVDVGAEIKIAHLEKIRGKTARQSPLVYKRLAPPYIQYKVPPVLIRLGKRRVKIDGREFVLSVDAKLYDFGVITVRFALPLSGSISELIQFSSILTESPTLRQRALSECLKIRSDIAQAVVKPRTDPGEQWEDYAVFMIQSFDQTVSANDLLDRHRPGLARILREDVNLSADEIGEATKNPLSYREDDLTLIDWNAAFVYDSEANYDVPDVIEFALIQLLELRLYDRMLDDIIDESYDMLAPGRPRVFPYSPALKQLAQIKLDIAEIIDRLEHNLKLVGDLYLARVYESASRRFYLEHWKSAVRSKFGTIESIFSQTWSRLQTTRMVILETAIVVLFVIDIILILIEIF